MRVESRPFCHLLLGSGTGNPRVFQGYLYLYPQNTHTCAEGTGIPGYGLRVVQVVQVRWVIKPVQVGCLKMTGWLGSDFKTM